MNALNNTLLVGIFYVLAGACGLARHFVLEPRMSHYPKAPGWLLNVFFAFAAVLIYAGLRYLWAWSSGAGATVPPGATGMGVVLSAALLIYKASLLANVLRQRYPTEVWTRLERVGDLARCSRPKR